jgi:tetratricopeptide (TPR) repeat protein
VDSPHFVVVGNSEAEDVQGIARQLEQVRVLFGEVLPGKPREDGPPLRVLVARDRSTLKTLIPEYWERSEGTEPAGVLFASPAWNHVVVRGDVQNDGDYSVVFHEYFHYWTLESGRSLPTWASEAMAMFVGSTRLTKTATELGRPREAWVRLLRSDPQLSLEEVLKVDASSAHYQDGAKAQRFYSQAWVLMHYLILGDDTGQRRTQLEEYLRRVGAGEPSLEVGREVFGDLKVLQRQVRGYSRKHLLPFLTMKPMSPVPGELRSRPLSNAEAAAFVGRFRVERHRTEETRALIDAAVAGAATLADTHEADARWWVGKGETERARQAFARAVSSEGAGASAHYGLAVLTLAGAPSEEAVQLAEYELAKALALDPRFAPALARRAALAHAREGCSERALGLIRQAESLWSRTPDYAIREATMLRECGRSEESKAVVRRILDEVIDSESSSAANTLCWRTALWGFGKEALGVCDRAVELSPDNSAIRDSRALARAVAGDTSGAIDDLRKVLKDSKREWPEEFRAQRSGWLEALERGDNPLGPTGLAEFRAGELGEVDWGL